MAFITGQVITFEQFPTFYLSKFTVRSQDSFSDNKVDFAIEVITVENNEPTYKNGVCCINTLNFYL